jgi:hypothetical protein
MKLSLWLLDRSEQQLMKEVMKEVTQAGGGSLLHYGFESSLLRVSGSFSILRNERMSITCA